MKHISLTLTALLLLLLSCSSPAPEAQTDSNTPLHLLQPDYIIPYGVPAVEDVKADLDRILAYIEAETPAELETPDRLARGAFRLTSYEWGVTYSGTLEAAAVTGDARYRDYAVSRHTFLAEQAPHFKELLQQGPIDGQMRQVVAPAALDDAGAVCHSMIRAMVADPELPLRPLIDNYMDFILNKEYRLSDGALARMRPIKNSVWLDDIYMGVPPIAWYGRLTGDTKYYDAAAEQILLFKKRMWLPEKHLFRHGWVEAMEVHPSFHWARANGWAFLAMSDVLDALPESHPQRGEILQLFKDLAYSLCALQSSEGFWHQLLDRDDSYLETSATAIYAYCLSHGICEGWLDPQACGPAAVLAWNAVSTKINEMGQVEGTCVGTGMAFDPAFYYYRPTSPYAAHGYGPAILAGAEMIRLIGEYHPRENDRAVQFYYEDYSGMPAIFAEPR